MTDRKTNNYLYKGETTSTCPVCLELIPARVHERHNKLYMEKFCPQHGKSSALISGDAQWSEWARKFNKPGEKPFKLASTVEKGCPHDCGICDHHEQHSCSIQIEITDTCDLKCKNCYMGPANSWFLPKERAKWMFRRMREMEGEQQMVMLTGGEPTLHPDLFEIARAAVAENIKHVLVTTNGNRIAKEADFAKRLADENLCAFLQLDGFKKENYTKLRGIDLLENKLKALENLEKHKCQTVLCAVMERGVNEDQAGDLIKYALSKSHVMAVLFMPITYMRNYREDRGKWAYSADACPDPLDRITIPELAQLIEEQTEGTLKKSDFSPIPCHSPSCGAVTYVIEGDHGTIPLSRFVQVDKYLDYIKNRARVDMDEVFQVTRMELEKLWSLSAVGRADTVMEGIGKLVNRCCCNGGSGDNKEFENKVTQVAMHQFMDPHTYQTSRARKCCIHFMLPSGKMMPLCNYNMFYRDRYRQEGLDKTMEDAPLHAPA
ncbi:MAG: radical SAM protein [bacterium]|nr:radical SAM protein [bacterium]